MSDMRIEQLTAPWGEQYQFMSPRQEQLGRRALWKSSVWLNGKWRPFWCEAENAGAALLIISDQVFRLIDARERIVETVAAE